MNWQTFSIFLYALLAIVACDSFKEDIKYAQGLETQGRFDLALREYRRLEENYADRPEILAGKGRVYSTRRASVFAGEYMLRRSLAKNHDRKVWWNLVRLYIAMGWYKHAMNLVQEPYLDLNELFDPEITRLRDGLKCLLSPGSYGRYQLEQNPEHVQRDFFMGLCLLMDHPEQIQIEAATQLYKNIKENNSRLACRLVNVWPLLAQPSDDFRSSELAGCMQEFIGEISIVRESMHIPGRAADAYPIDRQIFEMDRFNPGDPGRSDLPQWPAARELP